MAQFGITPPELSTTVPRMLPVAACDQVVCAHTRFSNKEAIASRDCVLIRFTPWSAPWRTDQFRNYKTSTASVLLLSTSFGPTNLNHHEFRRLRPTLWDGTDFRCI